MSAAKASSRRAEDHEGPLRTCLQTAKHPQQEFVQVDTSNILFICGGAFVGLDKVISMRMGKRSMGLHAEVSARSKTTVSETLARVEPEDLIKFGLIPEFIGRLPVTATLEELDEAALIEILSKPKNALVKQYTKLFEYDGVQLGLTKMRSRLSQKKPSSAIPGRVVAKRFSSNRCLT